MQPLSPAQVGTVGRAARSSSLLPTLLAALLGVFLLGSVGFAHVEVVHNAAHDTRHSLGFPCH